MLIDECDIKIIQEFNKLNGEKISTWNMMRKIYPKGRDYEYKKVTRKMEKMAKFGLFLIEINKGKHYQLIQDNAKVGKMKFPDNKVHDSVSMKICDKWWVFEI